MNDDEMKRLWQNQPAPRPVVAGEADLAVTAQQKYRKFQRIILWRDIREVGVGLMLLPVWFWLGARQQAPWTWYLMVPALVFVTGFMLVDRYRQRVRRPLAGEPVHEFLRKAVGEVEHQIWLLRGVLWWYIAPILMVLLIIDTDRFFRGSKGMVGWLCGVSFTLLLGFGIWWLNQYAAQEGLESRRKELQGMLEEIGGESGPKP
jgi:hypothetical protein